MKFTTKTKQQLKKQGYIIYQLEGKSLIDMDMKSKPFLTSWQWDQDFAKIKGRKMEVAINPDKLFIPESFNQTLNDCKKLIDNFKAPKGTKAELLSISEVCEILFQHFKKTHKRLTSEDYKYKGSQYEQTYAWTNTCSSHGDLVLAGDFGPGGIDLDDWPPDGSAPHLGVFVSLVASKIGSCDHGTPSVEVDFGSLEKKLDRMLEILEEHFT